MQAGFKSKFTTWLKRFARAESGVTAVEFAFIAPVVILMTCIMLETGAVVFSEYSLQSGIQRAARDVKIGTAQGAGMNLAAFKSRICTLAIVGIKCDKLDVYLKPYSSFNSLYTSTPNILDIGTDPITGTKKVNYGCGAASEAMVLIATYDWKFSIPYFMRPFGNLGAGDTRRMVGMAVFQNEPFTTTTTCSAT